MIKKLLTLIFTISITSVFSQNPFKVEKSDSVFKTKSQIYGDTKLFISEYWKSAKDVIQNDDKESGVILIKGKTKHSVNMGLGTLIDFWYSYNVKFLMKESKYKVIVESIRYDSGPSVTWNSYASQLEPQVQDNFPGTWKAGMNEKRWTQLMTELKTEMKGIVDDYEKQIKKQTTNGDW